MPSFQEEPAFQTIIKSKKFAEFPPEKRTAIMEALGGLTPEERAEFAAGIQEIEPRSTMPTPEEREKGIDEFLKPSEFTAKNVAPVVIGTAIGGPVGMAGRAVAGKVASGVAKKVIPFAADLVGNYLGEQATKAAGYSEGTPFGSPTRGDVASIAVPLAVKGALGTARAMTKPAQRAITEANETNTALQDQYGKDVEKVDTSIQRKVGQLEEAAAETNTKNQQTYDASVQAWRDKNQQMIRDYRQKLAEIQQDASLKQTDKLASEATETAAFQKRMQDHNLAFKYSPGEGTSGFMNLDYKSAYKDSAAEAAHAAPVDVEPFRQAALDVGIDLRQPAPGLQSPFVRITDALRGFGKAKAQPEAAPGQPEPPIKFEDVPLERVIETQKKLGQIIGKSKGDERYAAKQLWAAADEVLEEAAKADPSASVAVTTNQVARRAFKRAMAKQDWEEMWRTYSRPDPAGNREIQTGSLVKHYQDKYKQDRFNQQAWTPDEWKQMDAVVARAPTERVGKPPTIKPDILPDYSKARRPTADPMPQPKPEVQPDYEGANYPDYPEPPPTVEPQIGNFPKGDVITGGIAGAAVGGLVGESLGVGTYPGIVAGKFLGAGAVALPHFVSKYMLTQPHLRAIVENIMKGKRVVGPNELALLTSVAKKAGIPTDEQEPQ